jgi:hypothetical protein
MQRNNITAIRGLYMKSGELKSPFASILPSIYVYRLFYLIAAMP